MVVLEPAVKLGEVRGRTVQATTGQDVGQRGVSRLASGPRVLRHVAEGPASEHDPTGRVLIAAEDLEQACLAGAVTADQADLVAGGHGETRIGQDAARSYVDGEVPD